MRAMSEIETIEFVLHGQVDGREINPRTIGLTQFNQQVETLIGGSQKLKLDDVHVEIAPSSYALRALLPALVLPEILAKIFGIVPSLASRACRRGV